MDLSSLVIRGIPDLWKDGIARGWDVIDGATLDSDLTLEADVVIIGTGAGGGVSAEIFSQAGLKVILVEAGRLKSNHAFDMNEAAAYRDLYQEGAARMTKDGSVTILQGRAVGGTTVVNWTSSFRTPKQTLDYWASEFGVQGMSEEDMAPWFEQMESRLKISKWIMPPNANNNVIRRAAEKLGWHWDVIPRNVDGCWNLGYCGTGCPTNAKLSMLVTTLPAAMDADATLIHSTEAVRFEHDGQRVTAVHCRALGDRRAPTGKTIRLQAPTIIAAGGGINTPALLMRSQLPDPKRLLGKRTLLHLTSNVFGIYDEAINGYYGAPQSIYSDEFVWRDGVSGKAGYKLEVMPVHPGITAVLLDTPGQRHHDEIKQLKNLSLGLGILRDGFHPDSEGGAVELRDDGTPALDYSLNSYIMEGVRASILTQAEMHLAAGATKVRARHSDASWTTGWNETRKAINNYTWGAHFVPLGSAHVMGGCTMGTDTSRCLTDSNGRYHHLDNLYVFDGSVLPTSLGVNPQLTIYGMTARNATLLATRLTGVTPTA